MGKSFLKTVSLLLAETKSVLRRERRFTLYFFLVSLLCRTSLRSSTCFVDAFSSTSSLHRPTSSSLFLPPSLVTLMGSNDDHDVADPVASMEKLDDLLPRKEYITPLAKAKSNWLGAQQVIWHFSLLALAEKIPVQKFSIVAMAFVSSFFFQGLHECVHRTAFASNALNNLFAHVFGFLSFRPACHYRYYHWQHHKYTGNPELDSELQPGSFLDFPVESIWGYIFYLSGIPFWIDAISSIMNHAMGKCTEPYLLTEKSRHEVTREARIYFGLYTMITLLATMNDAKNGIARFLLRVWIVPAFLGQPFLRFYLLAEHRGRKSSPLIYENTRTMQTNWFYRKLAWSMPYHMEHHAWPAVPFYRLKDVHKVWIQAAKDHEKILEAGETIHRSSKDGGYIQFHLDFLKTLGKNRMK